MMERVTTITAEQFIEQDYDDIVFDNQAVVTFGDLKVVDITPRTDEFVMLWVYSERIGFDKVKVLKGEVLGVHWLDTAQTKRDAEATEDTSYAVQAMGVIAELKRQLAAAGEEHISTEYKYIGLQHNAIKLLFDDEYEDDSSEEEDSDYVKDNKIIEAIKGQNVTITHLKQQLASLQAERDALASQLAAAGDALMDIASYANDRYEDDQREMEHGGWKHGYYIIEEKAQAALQATPQPAPAPASELVAAVKPFADTLKRFDDNADDIGLFEWLNRYADEELVYDSLVKLAAAALKGE